MHPSSHCRGTEDVVGAVRPCMRHPPSRRRKCSPAPECRMITKPPGTRLAEVRGSQARTRRDAMTARNNPKRRSTEDAQRKAGVGRLANTSMNPTDTSANPRAEKPIGRPAQEVARNDTAANPATTAGGKDRARIVPPPNQGDSSEVTDHIIGGEPGETVY